MHYRIKLYAGLQRKFHGYVYIYWASQLSSLHSCLIYGEQENFLVKFSARMPSILIPATFCYLQLLQTNAQADAMASTHIHITPSLHPYILWHSVLRNIENAFTRTLRNKRLTTLTGIFVDYNNINSQLNATITNFIDNYNQLNMFRAIISPILRSTRLCLQLVV